MQAVANFSWNRILESLTAILDAPLYIAMNGIIAHALSWVGQVLLTLCATSLALGFLAIGFGLASSPAKGFAAMVVKWAFAMTLSSLAVYDYWVRDLFVTAAPHDLVAFVSGGATNAIGGHAYDIVWNRALDAGWTVWEQFGTFDFGEKLLVIGYWVLALLAVAFGYGIWLQGHIMVVVYVAVGPIFLPMSAFQATRGAFTAWIGALISCVVLQGLSVVLTTLLISAEGEIVKQVAGYTGGSTMMTLGMLMAAAVLFLLCAWFARKLPSAAAALCGGIHYHPEALVQATLGAGPRAMRAMMTGGVGAIQWATNRSRAGLRPPAARSPLSAPGPSLSRATPLGAALSSP